MPPIAPEPADPNHERYTTLPFPAYRFVPGRFPHPRRHPSGHSFGVPEPHVVGFSATAWSESEVYLYGVDLFNFAYWWECHEQWEAIWKHVGADSYAGRFLQGLVQIAAANLRQFMGSHNGGATLARKGLSRMEEFRGDILLGIDVDDFMRATEAHFSKDGGAAPVIDLHFPACGVDFIAAQ